MLKPLLMMRTRGLAGVVACKVANLSNHVAKSSGAVISKNLKKLLKVYNPLEQSPDWTLVDGPTSTVLLDEHGEYTFEHNNSESLVSYKLEQPIDVEFSAVLLYVVTGVQNSSFQLVVRATDIDNFIGVRTYDGKLQVYERVASVWSTPVEVVDTFTGQRITLKAVGGSIVVLADDVEVLTMTTTILTGGYVGVVSRSASGALPVSKEYSLVI